MEGSIFMELILKNALLRFLILGKQTEGSMYDICDTNVTFGSLAIPHVEIYCPTLSISPKFWVLD